jgi:hypothetical protein
VASNICQVLPCSRDAGPLLCDLSRDAGGLPELGGSRLDGAGGLPGVLKEEAAEAAASLSRLALPLARALHSSIFGLT